MPRLVPIALAALLMLGTGEAQAHAHLVGAEPGANAVVRAPSQLALHFSEKLVGPFSGIDLFQTSMPTARLAAPRKMKVKSVIGPDGKTLVGLLDGPLAPGSYRVDYHVVSRDTHRVKASYDFSVR